MSDVQSEIFEVFSRIADKDSVLADRDIEVINEVVRTAGSDTERIRLWGLVVSILMSKPDDARLEGVALKVFGQVINQRIERRTLHIVGTHLLDRLVLLLIRNSEFSAAYEVLREISAATNTLLLEAQFALEFLQIPREAGLLRQAGNLAFDAVKIDLAVDCAEASRHKFLSSLASGLASKRMSDHARLDLNEQFESVFGSLKEISEQLGAIDSPLETWATIRAQPPVESMLSNIRAEALVAYRSDGQRKFGAADDEDVWAMALQDPTVARTGSLIAEGFLLVYPFLSAAVPGFVLVWRGHITSIAADVANQGIESARKQSNFQGWCLASYIESGNIPDLDPHSINDVIFIDWDSDLSEALTHVAAGFEDYGVLASLEAKDAPLSWTLRSVSFLPTARHLITPPQEKTTSSNSGHISFFGDASSDLLGPWLEAHHLGELFGDRVRSYMGGHATFPRFAEALSNSSVLIVSCHGGSLGSRLMIELADGLVSADRILECRPEQVPPKVILAVCSGGSADQTPSDLELFGVVTTLLAIGVEEVMAPIVPVNDVGSAAVCTLIMSGVARGMSLREASLVTRRALVVYQAAGHSEVQLEIFDRTSQPADFPFDYDTAVERCCPALHTVVQTLDSYNVYGLNRN